MRDKQQHKGRECVYPEVPRTYHAGARGTFMDEHHHNLYFKDIDYNREPSFRWADVEHTFVTAMKPVYEATLEAMLTAETAHHVLSGAVRAQSGSLSCFNLRKGR